MTPWLDDGDVRLYHGDVLDVLAELPDQSVDCVVTSPPYWGLRDYGTEGQIGLEETPDLFVANMVAVFREVRRVLADHGTCWVNLGDSYASSPPGNVAGVGATSGLHGANDASGTYRETLKAGHATKRNTVVAGLKPKDLVGIPWRVAFALQADGWYLRSDIIWAKPNPMPESVTDRPTKSHEYVFLLTKQPRYWFDAEAVREDGAGRTDLGTMKFGGRINGDTGWHNDGGEKTSAGRNVRSVWQIATQPYPEAHFATFPEELARRCILAGCPTRVCRVCGKPSERIVERTVTNKVVGGRGLNGDRNDGGVACNADREYSTLGWSDCGHNNWRPGTVLDPFIGSGTVAKVARDHGRHAIGIDLSSDYLELAGRRLQQLSLLTEPYVEPVTVPRSRGLTGGAYSPPGQSPHSNARKPKA